MPRFLTPPRDWQARTARAQEETPEAYAKLLPHATITSSAGEYVAYDTFLYTAPDVAATRDEKNLLWSLIKMKRDGALRPLLCVPSYPLQLRYYLTDDVLETCERVARYATRDALQGAFPEILAQHQAAFLYGNLQFEEAILSSQLEGAATTRPVAADMLRSERKPRTEGERMIAGNLQMIVEAQQQMEAPLTPALLQALHRRGTSGIDDPKYRPGFFRTTDDIAVRTVDGFTVHQPPPAEGLTRRLEAICEWFNTPSQTYVHPMIRAIALHFLIAHEHPFHDGNGRVARALFYWAMLRSGYAAFLYVSISRYLKEAPAQYVQSFRRVQNDDMDVTYFLDAQARIIRRGLDTLHEHLTKLQQRMRDIRTEWSTQPAYNALNLRQKYLLDVSRIGITATFRAMDVQRNMKVSANTALSDLNGLVTAGFFEKRKEGRGWIYTSAVTL